MRIGKRHADEKGITVTKARRALVPLFVIVLVAAFGASSASAFRGHAFEKSFGKAGAGQGEFNDPTDVAVNEAAGRVYVLDQGNGRIEVFDHEGHHVSQFDGSETPAKSFSFGAVALTGGIAVDNACYVKHLSESRCAEQDASDGDVYVTDVGHEVVDKFSASGKYLGQLEVKGGGEAFIFFGAPGVTGVSVDAAGVVWVYCSNGRVDSFVLGFTDGEPSTLRSEVPLTPQGASFIGFGFAVDSADDFYVVRPLYPATPKENHAYAYKLDSTGTGLGELASGVRSPVSEEETSAVATSLSTSEANEVFLDNLSSVSAWSPSGVEEERFGMGDLAGGAGLAVDQEGEVNSTVYVADSTADAVKVFPPEPVGAPLLKGESVASVTDESATLQAEVDPHGASTEYHFEYGPCASEASCAGSPYERSAPVPDGQVGSDFEVHGVAAAATELLPDVTYHYRVVAHNEVAGRVEAVTGGEEVFTTEAAGAFALPDGRLWEMVSPPDKRGASIYDVERSNGFFMASAAGDALTYLTNAPTEPQPQGYTNNVRVLSARSGSGWRSWDLTLPHLSATGLSVGQGLTEFLFFSEDLSQSIGQPFGAFDPAVSPEASEQTPYLRSDYLHGEVSQPCLPADTECDRPLVTGVPGYADVPPGTAFGEEGQCPPRVLCGPQVVGATPDLSHVVLESSAALTSMAAASGALYEWSTGRLVPVSVLPGEGGKLVQGIAAEGRHAISTDGARVVWSAGVEGGRHLYLRETASGHERTVRLDPGLAGRSESQFQAANETGSAIYFTNEGDLYEFKVQGEELVALTRHAELPGAVLGVSEDGSYLYFVANAVLAPGAVPGKCRSRASRGTTCNLYVRHGETTTLVAVLSGEDAPAWATQLLFLDGRVSPDGRWLAFMSQRPLTGYDNRDALSGRPDEEVYLYHASSGSGEGTLVCASCNPTAARPLGLTRFEELAQITTGLGTWDIGTWLAADLPGWTERRNGESYRQPRYLSDSGRLFFNSHDALVPQDVNGVWDPYEYEPVGVGDCGSSSPSFSLRSDGCVGLLSSGTSAAESTFVDASEDGSDAFLLTAARLAPQDVDTTFDLYDAHECTSSSPCVPQPAASPPPCSTEASCRRSPSPQPAVFGTPASATFTGLGDVAVQPAAPAVGGGKTKSKPHAKPKRHRRRARRVSRMANPHKGGRR